ncbi:MAG: biotin/lipoate A/B protein ligase family protein [Opitutales bacterium]
MAMMPDLAILPVVDAAAVDQMARDRALLDLIEAVQLDAGPRAFFRHYTWSEPACTFGYSQKYDAIHAAIEPPTDDLALIRRATGGGLVDHRADWTYALAAAPNHPYALMPAQASYRGLHEALAEALNASGCPARVQPCAPKKRYQGPNAVCFDQPEIYDVVALNSGRKIAGAAQKRNTQGILVQGSLSREAIGAIDWAEFYRTLLETISRLLVAPYDFIQQPAYWADAVSIWKRQFATDAWNRRR